MTRVLLVSIALLALTACATDPGDQIVRSQELICAKEEPTGSRLVKERCWTREQLQTEEEAARAALEPARRQGPGKMERR